MGRKEAEERRGESKYFEGWFEKKGYLVYNLISDLYFEGEGDVLFAGEDAAYAGYLIRSDVDSHAASANLPGIQIISPELTDRRFCYLDTCFCPLNAQTIVYYPGAFDSHARKALTANFPDRIEVAAEEAVQLVCTAIVIGDHFTQPRGGGKSLGPALEARGCCVHEFDMSEFLKAGGATKCLVSELGETQRKTQSFA